MTRSLLPPLRTRRPHRPGVALRRPAPDGLTPGTRRTVAAIGALLVSFSVNAATTTRPEPAVGVGAAAE